MNADRRRGRRRREEEETESAGRGGRGAASGGGVVVVEREGANEGELRLAADDVDDYDDDYDEIFRTREGTTEDSDADERRRGGRGGAETKTTTTTVEELLESCRSAARRGRSDLLSSLDDVSSRLRRTADGRHDDIDGDEREKELVASSILRLDFVSDASYSSVGGRPEDVVDEALDLCGTRIALDAAVATLREASSSDTDAFVVVPPCSVAACLRTIRRIVLSHPIDDRGDDASTGMSSTGRPSTTTRTAKLAEECVAFAAASASVVPFVGRNRRPDDALRQRKEESESKAVTAALDDLAELVLLLPSLISSACRARRLTLPSWTTPTRFLPSLIDSACLAAVAEWLQDGEEDGEEDAGGNEPGPAALYFRAVLKKTARRAGGSVGEAAVGLRRCRDRLVVAGGGDDGDDNGQAGRFAASVRDALLCGVRTPRDAAALIRSVLRLEASSLDVVDDDVDDDVVVPRSVADRFVDEQAMPYLRLAALPSLRSSSELRDAAVRLLILSPSASSERADARVVTRCVAKLLSLCPAEAEEEGGEDDEGEEETAGPITDNEDGGRRRSSTLDRRLREIASTWSEPLFVRQTDAARQTYATEFVLSSLRILVARATPEEMVSAIDPELVATLVRGVTSRLESTIASTRRDGMIVAEALGPILGQDLTFDELEGGRDADEEKRWFASAKGRRRSCLRGEGGKEEVAEDGKGDIVERESATRPRRGRRRRRRRRARPQDAAGRPERRPVATAPIDPDAEYASDADSSDSSVSEGDGPTSGSSEGGDSDDDDDTDDDSFWDEEGLVPYDLSDDEQDLLETPRPLYLRDCLELLRPSDDDNLAHSKHETAMRELSDLVRSDPVDLPDVAVSLAKELLHVENMFDIHGFVELRHQGLVALTVREPTSVSSCLIEEMFGTVSLGTRFEALNALASAAEELSGSVELKRLREERRKLTELPDEARVSGKRRLVKDRRRKRSEDGGDHDDAVVLRADRIASRTRRWGKRTDPLVATNRFGPLAPMFFYPLLRNFSSSKSDESVWSGPNGSRFLSRFLLALSTFVECSGWYPGTSVLATDLFELAWSFRGAEEPEVRGAVLASVATCLPFLPEEVWWGGTFRGGNGGAAAADDLVELLRATALEDSDADCRRIAAAVSRNLSDAVSAASSYGNGAIGLWK